LINTRFKPLRTGAGLGAETDEAATSQPVPQGSAATGRYAFTGTAMEYFFLGVTNLLLALITVGFAAVLGVTAWRKRTWFISNTTQDGRPMTYNSTWGADLLVTVGARLLKLPTFGLAAPWTIAWQKRHQIEATRTAEGFRLRFDGNGGQVLGLGLLSVIVFPLTLGLGWPWLAVQWKAWETEHTLIEDPGAPGGWRRLRFDAGPLAYLVQGVLSAFLIVLTLGVYRTSALLNFERFCWGATADELSPRLKVPVGPQTTGQWFAVAAAAVGMVCLVGVMGTVAAAFSRRSGDSDRFDRLSLARTDSPRTGNRRSTPAPFLQSGEPPGPRPKPQPADVPAVSTDELAPQDQGFVDQQKGLGWGYRCYLHLRQGRYANGRAACQRGLAVPDLSAWNHGAILYNLGQIAEKTGDYDSARTYYEQSLQVRPTGAGRVRSPSPCDVRSRSGRVVHRRPGRHSRA
jgi:hypothetical protein